MQRERVQITPNENVLKIFKAVEMKFGLKKSKQINMLFERFAEELFGDLEVEKKIIEKGGKIAE